MNLDEILDQLPKWEASVSTLVQPSEYMRLFQKVLKAKHSRHTARLMLTDDVKTIISPFLIYRSQGIIRKDKPFIMFFTPSFEYKLFESNSLETEIYWERDNQQRPEPDSRVLSSLTEAVNITFICDEELSLATKKDFKISYETLLLYRDIFIFHLNTYKLAFFLDDNAAKILTNYV